MVIINEVSASHPSPRMIPHQLPQFCCVHKKEQQCRDKLKKQIASLLKYLLYVATGHILR